MAVAHDAATESATFTTTSPHTFSHTPSGTPAGIILCIAHGSVSTDLINSTVSYGGVAMQRIATAADTAGEPGRSYLYFLGAGIPTGTQTVSIAHTGSADVKWAAVASVTAAADTEASGGMWFAGDPSANISEFIFKARSGLTYSALYSGLAAPSDVTLGAGLSAIHDHDFGNFIARFDRETNPSSGLFNLTMTHGTDDAAICTVNISEKPTTGAHVIGGGVPFTTTSTTSQTLTYCGEMIDRDLYVFAVSRDSTSASANVTCTDNSGVGSWARVNGDTDKKAWVWWKRGTAADVGATITVAAAVGSCQISIAVCNGTNGAAGDPTTNLTDETNISGNETHGSIDPTNDNSALLFGIFDYGNDTNAATSISGATSGSLTLVAERLSSGGNDCRLTIACDEVPSGATGNVTWSQTDSTTKTVLFAIAPGAFAGSVSPGVIARSVTISQVNAKTSGYGRPDATARAATVPSVTVKGAAKTTPALTAAPASIPAVTVKGAAKVTPAVTARSTVIPQVLAFDSGAPATVTPGVIARSATIGQVVVNGASKTTPGAISVSAVIPQVTLKGGAVIAPALIDLDVTIPQVSANAGGTTVTPSVIARVATVSQVTLKGGVTVSPASTASFVLLPGVTVKGAAEVEPGVIAVIVSIPQAVGDETDQSPSGTVQDGDLLILIVEGALAASGSSGAQTMSNVSGRLTVGSQS